MRHRLIPAALAAGASLALLAGPAMAATPQNAIRRLDVAQPVVVDTAARPV